MVRPRSFSTELCKDAGFYLALTVITITSIALVISLADWLAWIFIDHGEFMTRMTIEIIQNESIWETAAWVLAALGGVFAIVIITGRVLGRMASKYPEAGE